MTQLRLALVGIPMLSLVAACGGTTGGAGGGSAADIAYADASGDYRALLAEYPGNAGSLTPIANIPFSGTAAFDGNAAINLPTAGGTTSLVGDSEMTVNFNSDTFTGRMDDFYGTEGGAPATRYAGQLTMTGGTLNVTRGFVLQSGLGGTLSNGSDTLQVNGTLGGNFHESNNSNQADAVVANLAAGSAMIYNGQLFVVPVGGAPSASGPGLTAIMERD